MKSRRMLRLARAAMAGRRGMSLVEVMVVIAIILTLMAVLMFGVFTMFGQAQQDTTVVMMGRVDQQIQIYQLRKKKVPSSIDEVFTDGDPPLDAWGNPFQLVTPGPGDMDYDIISLGADGSEGGDGDNADLKWSESKP